MYILVSAENAKENENSRKKRFIMPKNFTTDSSSVQEDLSYRQRKRTLENDVRAESSNDTVECYKAKLLKNSREVFKMKPMTENEKVQIPLREAVVKIPKLILRSLEIPDLTPNKKSSAQIINTHEIFPRTSISHSQPTSHESQNENTYNYNTLKKITSVNNCDLLKKSHGPKSKLEVTNSSSSLVRISELNRTNTSNDINNNIRIVNEHTNKGSRHFSSSFLEQYEANSEDSSSINDIEYNRQCSRNSIHSPIRLNSIADVSNDKNASSAPTALTDMRKTPPHKSGCSKDNFSLTLGNSVVNGKASGYLDNQNLTEVILTPTHFVEEPNLDENQPLTSPITSQNSRNIMPSLTHSNKSLDITTNTNISNETSNTASCDNVQSSKNPIPLLTDSFVKARARDNQTEKNTKRKKRKQLDNDLEQLDDVTYENNDSENTNADDELSGDTPSSENDLDDLEQESSSNEECEDAVGNLDEDEPYNLSSDEELLDEDLSWMWCESPTRRVGIYEKKIKDYNFCPEIGINHLARSYP
ncbi:hypothetical protein TKK_0015514 [Trichogramma kaykai]